VDPLFAAGLLSPLMLGVINRTKSIFGGRIGPPLFQAYYDLFKCCEKAGVQPDHHLGLSRRPVIGLGAVWAALESPRWKRFLLTGFPGDFVLMVYLLGCCGFLRSWPRWIRVRASKAWGPAAK